MADPATVTLPVDAVRSLYAVYHAWTREVIIFDSSRLLVSYGVRLNDIAGLLSKQDSQRMAEVTAGVQPHEAQLRETLGWT